MSPIRVERFEVGPLATNCYLVYSGGKAIVVDPGWPSDVDAVHRRIRELEVEVEAIVATHGHFDHILGVGRLRELGYEAPFMIHANDAAIAASAHLVARQWLGVSVDPPPAPDELVREGLTIRLGGVELAVWETPGHSPGSVTLLAGDSAIVGDVLFRGSIGRVDLPGGSWEDMKKSLRRLAALPRETKVYPGHGPSTSIGLELADNYFVKVALEESET